MGAALLLLYSQLPLGTAFEMGDDEGFEVIKGFMCSKGYTLYTHIWNDQPPVSTMLLSTAFKLCGPTILTARLVAAGFGLLLVAAFHELVRRRSGPWAALLATFLLVASPGVLLLMVSVMLEAPALATALLSAWVLAGWYKRRHWAWLLASGGIMAVAMQIKLTSALVVPAVVVELFLASWARARPLWPAVSKVLCWGASVAVVFTVIGLTWGKGALESSWKSHTSSKVVEGLDRPEDHKFEPRLLRSHVECVAGAAVGIIVALRRSRWREIAFPLVLLTTVSAIHAVHRPWWNYYYLHLAIPLAWLAGWTLNEIIQAVRRLQSQGGFNLSSAAAWKGLALCGLAALAIARSERRLEANIKYLQQRPAADANPIVRKMKEYAGRASWVYSESGIYPFHARLRVPPELAIVMPKRFWSGQITTAEIIEDCKRYRPELVVLPVASLNEEWKRFLSADYVFSSADTRSALYVAKRLSEAGE